MEIPRSNDSATVSCHETGSKNSGRAGVHGISVRLAAECGLGKVPVVEMHERGCWWVLYCVGNIYIYIYMHLLGMFVDTGHYPCSVNGSAYSVGNMYMMCKKNTIIIIRNMPPFSQFALSSWTGGSWTSHLLLQTLQSQLQWWCLLPRPTIISTFRTTEIYIYIYDEVFSKRQQASSQKRSLH